MKKMIKKVSISICLLTIGVLSFAQEHVPNRVNTYSDEAPTYGFTKENIFVGGSLALGYNGWDFNAGISPEVGWTLARWLDAGLLVNFNYSSERADPEGIINYDTRYRAYNYGLGGFARIYPVNFYSSNWSRSIIGTITIFYILMGQSKAFQLRHPVCCWELVMVSG
jgi:hypothetical protein